MLLLMMMLLLVLLFRGGGGRLEKILLPSAKHLEEGKGTTEAGELHKQVVL